MDEWQELLELLEQIMTEGPPDIARKAQRALVCYHRCVMSPDDIEDDDSDDLFLDY